MFKSLEDFVKIRNKVVLSLISLMYFITAIAYCVEILKGSRDEFYVISLILIMGAPLVVITFHIAKRGWASPILKHVLVTHFIAFYIYVLLSAKVDSAWGYVFPLMCVIIIYLDWLPVIMTSTSAIVVNVIYFILEYRQSGDTLLITHFEQRLASIGFSGLFLAGACFIMRGYYTMLMQYFVDANIEKVTGYYNIDSIGVIQNNNILDSPNKIYSMLTVFLPNFSTHEQNYGIDFTNKALSTVVSAINDTLLDYKSYSIKYKMVGYKLGVLIEGHTAIELSPLLDALESRINSIILHPKENVELPIQVYVVLTDTSYSEEHSFYSLQNRSNYLLKQCKDKNTFILWG